MALVDHEAVLQDLELYVLSRKSHGQRHLLEKLAELRQEHRIPETTAQRFLRTAEVLDSEPADEHPIRVHVHGP